MKEYKNITGSSDQPLYVGKTTVYIRSNIEPYREFDETGNVTFDGYIYDEIQMTKDEYIEYLADKNQVEMLENKVSNPLELYNKADIESLSLEEFKTLKLNKLSYLCQQAIYGRFSCNIKGKIYDFSYDQEAQLRFTGSAVLFVTQQVKELLWTAYLRGERVRIALNKDDFNLLSQAAMLHQNNNIVKYNELHSLITSMKSKEEVKEVTW